MTEKVYVSCSEEEEEVPVKKFKESATENSDASSVTSTVASSFMKEAAKPKNTSPQKVKQASLMSFFKKK